MNHEPINIRIAWWIAEHLPPRVLLYAVVRAFAPFGDDGNHNYKEVYDMTVEKYGIKDS